MNFTYNNHLKYYINDRLYGFREHPYEKFTVDVGKIDKDHYSKSNWVQEQYRIAELVTHDFGSDFNVMFSGGTDSEIVLRALKHIGAKPNVFFIRFNNGYNHTDYLEAIRITDDMNIKFNVIDFDVVQFYKSGQATEFSKDIQCRQMAYLVVLHHILKLNTPSIMGGELFFQRTTNIDGGKWHYSFRENEDGAAMRFSIKYNIPLVNEWFSYTPEVMAYYIMNPKIQNLFNDRYNYKLGSPSTKNSILREYMPEIVCSMKLTGYENLLGFNFDTYQNLYNDDMVRFEPSLDGIYVDDITRKLFD